MYSEAVAKINTGHRYALVPVWQHSYSCTKYTEEDKSQNMFFLNHIKLILAMVSAFIVFSNITRVLYFSMQSAEKQGNQLHMNVYKMKGQACGGPLKTEVKELKGDLRPAPPYPSRVKTVDKGTQVTPEREAVRNRAGSPSHLHCSCCSKSYVRFILKLDFVL